MEVGGGMKRRGRGEGGMGRDERMGRVGGEGGILEEEWREKS